MVQETAAVLAAPGGSRALTDPPLGARVRVSCAWLTEACQASPAVCGRRTREFGWRLLTRSGASVTRLSLASSPAPQGCRKTLPRRPRHRLAHRPVPETRDRAHSGCREPSPSTSVRVLAGPCRKLFRHPADLPLPHRALPRSPGQLESGAAAAGLSFRMPSTSLFPAKRCQGLNGQSWVTSPLAAPKALRNICTTRPNPVSARSMQQVWPRAPCARCVDRRRGSPGV